MIVLARIVTKPKTGKGTIEPASRPDSPHEKGFDFGEQLSVMVVTDFGFNQALREAKVFGCAYGAQTVDGFPAPMPALTLIGENRAAFQRAFDTFSRWGCQLDGSVVEIAAMLRLSGGYDLWIGPEMDRASYRLIRHKDLCREISFNTSWVKHFDSVQPFLLKLKRYRESVFSPVLVGAAIAEPGNLSPSSFQHLETLPPLVTFDLKIIAEAEAPSDPHFHVGDQPPTEPSVRPPQAPDEYRSQRNKTLDVAFPVSRERIRRSALLKSVTAIPGYAGVSETQVVQAAINLMLSGELAKNDQHYSTITSDLPSKVWQHIYSRYESANGETSPADQEPVAVARQLRLDVEHVLRSAHLGGKRGTFSVHQQLFRAKGYVDD